MSLNERFITQHTVYGPYRTRVISKLTDSQANVIRQSGEKASVLAQIYGVSESTIRQIRNNKSRVKK